MLLFVKKIFFFLFPGYYVTVVSILVPVIIIVNVLQLYLVIGWSFQCNVFHSLS